MSALPSSCPPWFQQFSDFVSALCQGQKVISNSGLLELYNSVIQLEQRMSPPDGVNQLSRDEMESIIAEECLSSDREEAPPPWWPQFIDLVRAIRLTVISDHQRCH